MFAIISLALSIAAGWAGFGGARRFVRRRLRYVDAVQKGGTALIAGIGAAVVAAPIVWLLPLVSAATAVVFGVSVGLGVRAGAADVRRGYLISSGD